MRLLAALTLATSLSLPAAAQTVIAEASGNWAGASEQGFHFRAQLVQADDRLGLRIWNAIDGVPPASGEPAFDNGQIELGAFATKQALELFESPTGTTLQIVVEFADEKAEGRSVTQIQFLDNQFTVVGYYHRSQVYNPDVAPGVTECDVDLWYMVVFDDGVERRLEPVGFEALNASDWTWGAAFDRGFCTRGE
jgi:hypothetical protein